MKLTVLIDDNTHSNCSAEHGLSYHIELNGINILFDAGATDLFLKNAKKLGVNLDEIDFVVLSHGHWDHGNGLEFIKGKQVITHSGSFIVRRRRKDDSFCGVNQNKLNHKFVLSRLPVEITENVWFLGEIPRETEFELSSKGYYLENNVEDPIKDDSGIVVKTEKGLVVIAGCSHAGICNIVERAKKVSGQDKVHAIIGGFHLKKIDEQTLKTIEYFKEQKVKFIHPAHCVSKEVSDKFSKELNSKRIGVGDVLEF